MLKSVTEPILDRDRSRWRGLGWHALAWLLWPAAAAAQPAPASLPPPVEPACISSPFGPRALPGPHAAAFHNGIDFPAPAGAWVSAVAPGKVIEIRRSGAFGLEILLAHDGHGSGEVAPYVTRYAHLGSVSPALAEGRKSVARGERLGRVGRTGITYGTHVHFEVRVAGHPIDPEPFFMVQRCNTRSESD